MEIRYKSNNMFQALTKEIMDTRKGLIRVVDYGNGNVFAGKCYDASVELCERIRGMSGHGWKIVEAHGIHGELAHIPMIRSKYWPLEHTMVKANVIYNNHVRTLYLDATSEQFQEYCIDIPSYYIGLKCPRWFYPDYMNPRWSYKSRFMQDLIAFFQYDIWGPISDFYWKHFPDESY